MADPKLVLLSLLVLMALGFAAFWLRALRHSPGQDAGRPSVLHTGIGFLTNFFDTLGIGSLATTTSIYRPRQLVPDRLIPGTLNVGHALPTIAQALIYIAIIEVDLTTLLLMIAASVVGAFVGADVVARWPERKVRIGMGICLLGAACLMLARLRGVLPPGGQATSLSGTALGMAVAGNFLLGVLMTMGIGLYAPCMILVSLLGMSPKVAFPIMMGSCAFLMPVASARFIQRGSYATRPALGLALGGVPGVLLAAYIVKELPLDALRWLVLVVVVYTAASMLRAALRPARTEAGYQSKSA